MLLGAASGVRGVSLSVVRAVRRDIGLAGEADDPDRAAWVLCQGLTLLPREERLRPS